jgi:hypothetical protein
MLLPTQATLPAANADVVNADVATTAAAAAETIAETDKNPNFLITMK